MVQTAEKYGLVGHVAIRKKSPPGERLSPEKVYDRKFKAFVMHKEIFAFVAAHLIRKFQGVPYQTLVPVVQREDRERDTARLDTLAGFRPPCAEPCGETENLL